MTTKEAIQAMLDGNKVMPKGWVDACVFFNGTHFVREDGKQFLFGSLDYEWEIYEEPKPKQTVTIEKWLITNGRRYDISFTSDIYDYLSKTSSWTNIKLLDTYEVTL